MNLLPPEITDDRLHQLADAAKQVLDKNWTGEYTIPAAGQYPHQWSWDSGFIAMGYAHYHQERAQCNYH